MEKRRGWFYLIVTIIFLFILFYFRDSEHFVGAISFILAIVLVYIIDKTFNWQFKKIHYIILIIMTGAGLLLSPLYVMYASYDKLLHFVNPFLGCILVFYIVNKFNIDFKAKLFITFTIMMSLITFTEIVEFVIDSYFDLKLQGVFRGEMKVMLKHIEGSLVIIQDKNTDTMIDLILGTLGSLFFVIVKSFSKKK